MRGTAFSSTPVAENRGIKSWPVSERPRERLVQNGVSSLSDAELIAVLLRTGVPGKNAITFARELLSRFGGLRGVFAVGWAELQQIKGLGQAKIATFLAAQEIARRQLRERILGKRVFDDPEAVLDYLYSSLRDQKREIFKVFFLDKGCRILNEADLFRGTLDGAAIYPREILQAAFERHAAALILVHNHPSGRAEPSPEDRKITRELEEVCRAVSISLLDHIIVGANDYFSFQEHGLLEGKSPGN